MITLVRSMTMIHGAFSLEIFVCLKIEKSYEARELVATVFVVWVIVVCIWLANGLQGAPRIATEEFTVSVLCT